MLLLVLGANYLIMFIGWEGVGLCSYLLIGFWFKNLRLYQCRKESIRDEPHRRPRFYRGHAAGIFHYGTTYLISEFFRQAAPAASGTGFIYQRWIAV